MQSTNTVTTFIDADAEQTTRERLDVGFANDSFAIYNGWLVETVNECTCGLAGLGGHEIGCGAVPMFDIAGRMHEESLAEAASMNDRFRTGMDREALISAMTADLKPWVLRSNPYLRFTDAQKSALHGLDLDYQPRGSVSIAANPILHAYVTGTKTAAEVMTRLGTEVTAEQYTQAATILSSLPMIEQAYATHPTPAPHPDDELF